MLLYDDNQLRGGTRVQPHYITLLLIIYHPLALCSPRLTFLISAERNPNVVLADVRMITLRHHTAITLPCTLSAQAALQIDRV